MLLNKKRDYAIDFVTDRKKPFFKQKLFYQTPNVWDLSLVSREGVFTALTINITTIRATTAIPIHSNTIYYPYAMILEKLSCKNGIKAQKS